MKSAPLSRNAGLLLAVALSSSALAGDKAASAAAQARYLHDRAVCIEDPSRPSRAACLQEAGAALAQSRREGVEEDPAAYARNARRRCDALPQPERRACESRMEGQGTTSGSAAAGGIYRELIIRDTETPEPAATTNPRN